MSSIGNSGARSSGPTGWSVPGCSGGGGGAGRSGITLYHWRGISDSSRVILVRSATRPSDLQGNDLSRTLQCWSRGTTPWNPRTGGISSPQTPDGGVPPPHTPWPPWRGGSPAWRGKPGLAGEARVGGGSRAWRGKPGLAGEARVGGGSPGWRGKPDLAGVSRAVPLALHPPRPAGPILPGGSGDEGLDGRGQLGHRLLGVGEVHAGLGIEVQLVFQAGVAVPHRALDHDDGLGLVHVQDRHAGDLVARAA